MALFSHFVFGCDRVIKQGTDGAAAAVRRSKIVLNTSSVVSVPVGTQLQPCRKNREHAQVKAGKRSVNKSRISHEWIPSVHLTMASSGNVRISKQMLQSLMESFSAIFC